MRDRGNWIFAVPGILLLILLISISIDGVDRYNRNYRHSQQVAADKEEDHRLCRGLLGFDYDIGQRKLIMACAQEVIDRDTAKGISRSDAATTAWKSCMPGINACERALAE